MPKAARYPQANIVPDPSGDYLDSLAALWTLRLVLTTAAGERLLRSNAHADDLLAVIGPWVAWPKTLKAIFAQRLTQRSDDDWVLDELEDDPPGRPPSINLHAVLAVDWQTVDWRELNGVFSSIYAQQPARVIKLLKASIQKLEAHAPDLQEPLIINLTRLSQVLGLNREEQTVLLFFAMASEHAGLRTLLRALPYRGLHKVCHLLTGVLDRPAPGLCAALHEAGALRRIGLIAPTWQANDLGVCRT